MDKLRDKYEKLRSRHYVHPARSDTSGVLPSTNKAPLNMSKTMLEKYITWHDQVNNHDLRELQQLLKGNNITHTMKSGTKLVREYQGQKHEVSIIDGDFFYGGTKYKSLSKIAREITGTNWNGKLFFRVTGTK